MSIIVQRQRLIRVLVYEGPPEWIQDCLSRRGVKGSQVIGNSVIKEAIVGDFLESVIIDSEFVDGVNLTKE